MMGDVEETTSESTFRKLCRSCTKSAFLDVLCWSHPDGGGVCKRKLLERVRAALSTQEESYGNAA